MKNLKRAFIYCSKKIILSLLGYCGFNICKQCEIEFYISKTYRKNGYCTEAASELVCHVFSEGVSVDGNRKYADLKELTPYALRELVKAIYIRVLDELNGKRRQEIRIEYDLVGYIPLDKLMEQEKQGQHDRNHAVPAKLDKTFLR